MYVWNHKTRWQVAYKLKLSFSGKKKKKVRIVPEHEKKLILQNMWFQDLSPSKDGNHTPKGSSAWEASKAFRRNNHKWWGWIPHQRTSFPSLIANRLLQIPLEFTESLKKNENRERIAWRRVSILQDVPFVSGCWLIRCQSANKDEGHGKKVNQLHFLLCSH